MLYRVNLLPWREQRRAEHRRRFIGLMVLAVVIAGGVQAGVGHYVQHQQKQQQERLRYLEHYITQLDRRIETMKIAEEEHSQILARIQIVETLQQGRNKTTEFMNLMPSLIPEGVFVDKIKMNDRHVEVSGIADSTARLATMLDNMERSSLLSEVEMHSIVLGNKRFGKDFQTFKVSFRFEAMPPPPMPGEQHG